MKFKKTALAVICFSSFSLSFAAGDRSAYQQEGEQLEQQQQGFSENQQLLEQQEYEQRDPASVQQESQILEDQQQEQDFQETGVFEESEEIAE